MRYIAVIVLLCGGLCADDANEPAQESRQFESYFPLSAEGTKQLETWWSALNKSDQTAQQDEKALEIIRNGLRGSEEYATQILQWVSSKYIWQKESAQVSGPVRDKAIELIYHASFSPDGLVRYYAVYYGLSILQPKPQHVLDRLATLAMRGENASRVVWGVQQSNQQDEFLKHLEPCLASDNPELRQRAEAIAKQVQEKPGYLFVPQRTEPQDKPTREPNEYEGTFTDLYNVLGKTYPCFELKGIDWQAVGDELLPHAKQVETHEEFGLLSMELVARLEDSHAYLMDGTAQVPAPPLPRWDAGFACLEDDQDRPAVYYVDPCGPADEAGVKVGMVVLTVNGQPVREVIEDAMALCSKYIGYSSDRYLRYDSYRSFPRRGKQGEVVTFEMLAGDGARHQFELPAVLSARYLPRLPVPKAGIPDSAHIAWKMLDDRIGYIYVRRISARLPGLLDKAVGELKDARGLIVDVRGNSGGGFEPREAFVNFGLDGESEPNRPRYKGPMALLIDSRCISAGEGWASWFIAKNRARVFGEPTAGASARKDIYTLSNGLYKVQIPIRPYRGSLNRPIERRGLEPDVHVRQSAADLAIGRDTVLEAAKAYLLEQTGPSLS
jgi:C-terminal processing protease CtpA/Prc